MGHAQTSCDCHAHPDYEWHTAHAQLPLLCTCTVAAFPGCPSGWTNAIAGPEGNSGQVWQNLSRLAPVGSSCVVHCGSCDVWRGDDLHFTIILQHLGHHHGRCLRFSRCCADRRSGSFQLGGRSRLKCIHAHLGWLQTDMSACMNGQGLSQLSSVRACCHLSVLVVR